MKNKIKMLLLLIFFSKTISAQSIVTDIITNGNISHLDNILDINQIIDYKGNDLRILRNSIFAKYGYKFISEDLTAHFSQFPWYQEYEDNIEDRLTSIDWENIRLINRLENARNIFSIDDFTREYAYYYLKEGRECIIFNQIYKNMLNMQLIILLCDGDELSKYIEKINMYMDFIGYKLKDELINAYKKNTGKILEHTSNVNEWYTNLSISHPFISIEDGQIRSSFYIYTYINNKFAGRFVLFIEKDKKISIDPFGRE
jgi:hypothetical protein